MRTRHAIVFLSTLLAGSTGSSQVTESPTAVGRSSWLVESDVFTAEYRREGTAEGTLRETGIGIGAVTVSTGIADGLDLQLGTELFVHGRVTLGSMRESVSGRGDSYIRMRWNFAGDEESGPAFALLPWVRIPTADDDIGSGETDFGLIVPFGMPLAGGGAFNAMVEVARPGDGAGNRNTEWFVSASAVMPLLDRWEWYLEATAGFSSFVGSDPTAAVGAGLRWGITDSFVMDLELLAGLTRASPDWSPALRIEWGF